MRLRAIAVVEFVALALLFTCNVQAQQHTVKLSWTSPAQQNGITVTGFKVYRGTAANGEGTSAFATVSSAGVTTFTDTAVTAGTTYFYKVTATATCNPLVMDCSQNYTLQAGTWIGESDFSNEASAGPIPLPVAPKVGAPISATATVQ